MLLFSLKLNIVSNSRNFREFKKLAAATSSQVVHLFNLNSSNGFTQLQKCDDDTILCKNAICGVRFGKTDENDLYIATTGGKIYKHDLRTKGVVQEFENADTAPKPFSCFDINADDSVLCVGTEKSKLNDSHVVLFDVRKTSPLLTFTDSHQDDLTQVKFHPSKPKTLATGSFDGLINVFDISESDEDDALEYCLNTESSVQILNWHRKSNMQVNDDESADILSCITDTNDFQMFDVDESELIFQTDRKDITDLMKRKVYSDCYLINCHTTSNGDVFLLGGSQYNAGECLRSLTVHDKVLKPRNIFNENKQLIRCSVFNPKVMLFIS